MSKLQEESFIEAALPGGNREVIMTVIRSGWGNKRHNHYYPASTLQEAARRRVFDGVRMYANHLSDSQRKLLGGLPRDIRDITGRILETWYDASSQSLKAKAKLVPWFHSLVESDPSIVEASINAGGRATPRVIEGRQGRFVESILQGESVDWVPVGGAGGKIDSLLEAHMEEQTHMYEDLTVEGLVEGNAALVKEILDSPLNERAVNAEARIKALEEKLAEAEAKPESESGPVGENLEEAGGEAYVKLTEAEFNERVQQAADSRAQALLDEYTRKAKIEAGIDSLIEAARDLKPKSKAAIKRQFEGADFESMEAMTESVQSAINERLEELQEALGEGEVVGLGPSVAADVVRARRSGGRRGSFNRAVDAQLGIVPQQPATEQPAEAPAA